MAIGADPITAAVITTLVLPRYRREGITSIYEFLERRIGVGARMVGAISFIVFDLETVFLIPWAVEVKELGWSAFVAMTLFVIVLAVGLLYEWKKGGLEWD